MGHLWVLCVACHEDHRESMFYEPPHDIRHREPGPWRPLRLELRARQTQRDARRRVRPITRTRTPALARRQHAELVTAEPEFLALEPPPLGSL